MPDVTFTFYRLGLGGGLTWVRSLGHYLQQQGYTVQLAADRVNPEAGKLLELSGIPWVIGVAPDSRLVIDSSGGVCPRGKCEKLIVVRHSRRTWLSGWYKATRNADAIVAVSIPVAANTVRMTGRRDVVTINNGVDFVRLDTVKQDLRSRATLGFVGRFSPLKRPERVAAMADELGLTCLLVGDGYDTYPNVQNRWTVRLPYTPWVGDVYRAISTVVTPSKHEAFPYTVIEALCLGCRVITVPGAVCEEFRDLVTVAAGPATLQLCDAFNRMTTGTQATRAQTQTTARSRFSLDLSHRKWLRQIHTWLGDSTDGRDTAGAGSAGDGLVADTGG